MRGLEEVEGVLPMRRGGGDRFESSKPVYKMMFTFQFTLQFS